MDEIVEREIGPEGAEEIRGRIKADRNDNTKLLCSFKVHHRALMARTSALTGGKISQQSIVRAGTVNQCKLIAAALAHGFSMLSVDEEFAEFLAAKVKAAEEAAAEAEKPARKPRKAATKKTPAPKPRSKKGA